MCPCACLSWHLELKWLLQTFLCDCYCHISLEDGMGGLKCFQIGMWSTKDIHPESDRSFPFHSPVCHLQWQCSGLLIGLCISLWPFLAAPAGIISGELVICLGSHGVCAFIEGNKQNLHNSRVGPSYCALSPNPTVILCTFVFQNKTVLRDSCSRQSSAFMVALSSFGITPNLTPSFKALSQRPYC